jgi:hypothetical protein
VRKPGVDPFADHTSLELGEDPTHLKHRSAGRPAGVEHLLMQIQMAVQRLQLRQEFDQILEAATESID